MSEASALLVIAHRDLVKLLRDRQRMVTDFAFPIIMVAVLGTALQSGFGERAGINLLHFVFTGVLGMTAFQSTAQGLISLVADREQDFSQEIFVSPISRYTIVGGKILGEALVAMPQVLAIVLFGLVVQVPLSAEQLIRMGLAGALGAFLGGSFGVFLLATVASQRVASQIFTFVLLPQYFLAGIFNPIGNLPFPLDILSKLSPMRYAVDLMRDAYYAPSAERVQLFDAPLNLAIIGVMFALFMVIGTALFVRSERNR